jgi:hypothetical protein
MFETFYNITYFFEVVLTSAYGFIMQCIVPSAFDLILDVYQVLGHMCYESCMVCSAVLLQLGKWLTGASEYMLIKAEQIGAKIV